MVWLELCFQYGLMALKCKWWGTDRLIGAVETLVFIL